MTVEIPESVKPGKKTAISTVTLATLIGMAATYSQLPDNLRFPFVTEVIAGDAVNRSSIDILEVKVDNQKQVIMVRMDNVEEADLEDRLERLWYRFAEAQRRANAAPRDEVLQRGAISLERQINKAEARLEYLRDPETRGRLAQRGGNS